MTHDPELARKIMLDAGADESRLRIEEYGGGEWLVAARGFGAGVTSRKEEAFDTVQEVAAHLVACAFSQAVLENAALAGLDIAIEGADVTPAEANEDVSETPVAAPAEPEGDAGADAGSAPGGDAERADSGGVDASADDLLQAMDPMDADFTEPEPVYAGPLSLEPPALEVSLPALEGADVPLAEPPPEPREPPHEGGIVYFGDDIHVIRLAKMGRLAQIARELKDALGASFSLPEFRSLQNWVMRMDQGVVPDDVGARNRFIELSEISSAMSYVDAYKDQRELELESCDRAGVEAFDPEEGWPT